MCVASLLLCVVHITPLVHFGQKETPDSRSHPGSLSVAVQIARFALLHSGQVGSPPAKIGQSPHSFPHHVRY
jgi:hypothetical protein